MFQDRKLYVCYMVTHDLGLGGKLLYLTESNDGYAQKDGKSSPSGSLYVQVHLGHCMCRVNPVLV